MTAQPYELVLKRACQIGLIVLQADETIEHDMRRMLPPSVEFLVSRVPSGTHVTLDTLSAMEVELKRAAALFPEAAVLRAVGYGCTSGSAQIGSGRVAEAVRAGKSTEEVSDPVTALIRACRAMQVTRIGLLSPYIQSVSRRLCDVLEEAGIGIVAFASFEESEEGRVAQIAPSSIKEAAIRLAGSADMDAVFVSCTNLRTLDLIDTVEAETGVPMMTSNQVLCWDLLRLVGAKGQGPGALWRQGITPD